MFTPAQTLFTVRHQALSLWPSHTPYFLRRCLTLVQNGLELTIAQDGLRIAAVFLPQPPKCWDYRNDPPSFTSGLFLSSKEVVPKFRLSRWPFCCIPPLLPLWRKGSPETPDKRIHLIFNCPHLGAGEERRQN